jgi:hypothetical protein
MQGVVIPSIKKIKENVKVLQPEILLGTTPEFYYVRGATGGQLIAYFLPI